jgi:hypothetical protein
MKPDMSAGAVTRRLKRASQLRRLCLSLGKTTKTAPPQRFSMTTGATASANSKPNTLP